MVTVIERAEGRYEIQDVEFGKVYKWYPECVVVECDCGRRPTLTNSTTACRCGADHTAVVREELSTQRFGDELPHPWRSLHYVEDNRIPF